MTKASGYVRGVIASQRILRVKNTTSDHSGTARTRSARCSIARGRRPVDAQSVISSALPRSHCRIASGFRCPRTMSLWAPPTRRSGWSSPLVAGIVLVACRHGIVVAWRCHRLTSCRSSAVGSVRVTTTRMVPACDGKQTPDHRPPGSKADPTDVALPGDTVDVAPHHGEHRDASAEDNDATGPYGSTAE
jgi:hypothetical protein